MTSNAYKYEYYFPPIEIQPSEWRNFCPSKFNPFLLNIYLSIFKLKLTEKVLINSI